MAEAGRDLTETLFGAPTATAAPVDQWRQTLKLDDLERQYNLPSGLMTSVLRQESGGDPRVKSSAGAQGLFQFMPATARQYKIDPFDPQQAAPAAAKELSTLYKKYHGDVDRTLAAWNWGQGNVDRKGMANMPTETRGFLTNVKRFLGPGVAEAATPSSGRDLTTTLGQTTAGSGRDLTDMLFGATPTETPIASPQQPPQAMTPTPPTATSTPEQDAAYRGSVGQQEPASPRTRLEELEAELARRDTPQPAPVPTQPPAEEPITPERRFLDLPSSRQMSLEDRTQRFQEFYGLKPELKEEFLRSEEPPSDLVVDIEKPSPPAPTGWRAQLPQAPEEWDRRMAPMKQTAEETSANAIPMAFNMVPGMAGYNLGLKIAPKLGAIGKAVPPVLEALGGYAGHRANVKLGYEKEGPLGDVLSALPLAVRALGSGTAGWLERTISEAPVAARDQTMDLLSKLFSRGGAQGTLTYLLSGDPQMAAWVGGSYATARSLLGFALKHPVGKQLVEATLKAGRAIGGPELGMLLQIGRTGKAPADGAGTARTVDIAPMMNHPAWKGKLTTDQQRQEALKLWQDKDTSESDRAEMLKVMDGWLATPSTP